MNTGQNCAAGKRRKLYADVQIDTEEIFPYYYRAFRIDLTYGLEVKETETRSAKKEEIRREYMVRNESNI